MSGDGPGRPRVAIFPWGDVIEDYLAPIGLSVDDFVATMTGGWLFGYVEALQRDGFEPMVWVFSRDAPELRRLEHAGTGCPVRVLPSPPAHRLAERRISAGEAPRPATLAGRARGRARRLLARAAFEAKPFLATPAGRVARLLKEEGCRAVLAQEYEDPRFDMLALAAGRAGIPLLATYQGGDRQYRWLERGLRPRSIARCSGLVVASRGEAERVARTYRPACPVEDIPNPIDAAAFAPMPRSEARAALGLDPAERILVWHGRVDMRRKGLDVLLDAFDLVLAALPGLPLRLLLLGDGQDGALLEARIARSDRSRITWLRGFSLDRDQVRRVLSAADVAVSPSRHEGFPVAPLEAMAAALPLVGTDAPGVADIVAVGRAGGCIGVERGNAEALAGPLAELLADPDLSARLGARARERVLAHYGLDQVGRRLGDLLRRAMRQGGPEPV